MHSLPRFDMNANEPGDVLRYFRNRSTQLRGADIIIQDNFSTFKAYDYGCSIQYKNLLSGRTFNSLYVYANSRGKGFYRKWLEEENHGADILTMPDCRLQEFLQKHNVPHTVVGSWTEWPEYREISNYYGDDAAARSGLSLMNHIDEGFAILKRFGSDEDVLKAWLLHPLFQVDLENFHARNYGGLDLNFATRAYALSYAMLANSYLPKDWAREAPVVTNVELLAMLLADKIQNHKDAKRNVGLSEHKKRELDIYFGKWRESLDPKDWFWSEMTNLISYT